jgi:hypothetical protein
MVSIVVWVITFELSGFGDTASSYTNASMIILPRKPHHYFKVVIPTGGHNTSGQPYTLCDFIERNVTQNVKETGRMEVDAY